jgi:NADP-dependent 3-hydroxy acid dehydrogenase YdfG
VRASDPSARCARTEGARVILTGRYPERLTQAAGQIGAKHFAAFDASDTVALAGFQVSKVRSIT